jgi:ATP-dependent DNA helicase RecG
MPHLLAMSATPIPRSLALARHGDLDASFLTERPSGRRPPAALLCLTAAERAAAYDRVRDAVAAGERAFVVCPVREQAVRKGAVTAVGQHARLRRELAPARVGLLHGALDGRVKEAALRDFAAGATEVLVATTVVELGIDVPSATVIVIEDADRLGLATLHQLRGRVGRGDRPGICFLCPTAEGASGPALERLRLLTEIDDGFRLAEADLAGRGAGDLFGTQQAGFTEMIGDWQEVSGLARREAELLLEGDPTLVLPAHAPLARAARARIDALFGAEAG